MTEPSPQLHTAAHRLAGLSDEAYEAVVKRSYAAFAAGEGHPDPIDGDRFDGPPLPGSRPAAGDELTRDQVRSLLLAVAVAGHVVTDPDRTRALARANLRRMRASGAGGTAAGGTATMWLDAWERLLDGPLVELLTALTSPSPWSRELRQNSPFAGVLTDAERQRVLAVHRQSVPARAATGR
jgi:hypothetical protein